MFSLFRGLTLVGKVSFGIGILAIILGIILFVENNVPIKEQYLSFSFIFLGIASFFSLLSKQKGVGSSLFKGIFVLHVELYITVD